MKLIRKIGRKLSKNGNYFITYAIFWCEFCNSEVEKPISYKKCISCGCTTENKYKNKGTHNESKTRLHNIWLHIKGRCLNLNSDAFHNYGGRGITICNEWLEFIPFRDWSLSNGYADNLEIDRIKNDLGYSPENCQWITRKENKLKQRRIKLSLEIADEIRIKRKKGFSCKQLAKEYNVGLRQIYYIIHNKQWVSKDKNYEMIKAERINKKQINEIRELYKTDNFTQKELSEKYNLSQGYISEVITNKKRLL